MLDVQRLRLLRELADRGTIAAVAAALGYTASAVSQQLGTLEREAETSLLARTGRGVTLSPAGHALVRHADAVLAELERAEATLAAMRGTVAGPLRIGAYPTAARAVLPAALKTLARAHPDLDPAVREIDPAEVGAALRGGTLDVALVHVYDLAPGAPETGLDQAAVFVEDLHLAAPRSWSPLAPAAGVVVGWREAPWIIAPATTACGAMTRRVCADAGFSPRIRHVIDDFSAALELVAIGAGVALIPDLGIERRPRTVRFTAVPLRRRTLAACRAGAGGHPAIVAFVAALRDAAGERADPARC